jgi:ribosomal protein L5
MENDLKVHYLKHVVPTMMKSRAYTNGHQVPKLEKIVLNCSVGSVTDIKVALEDAVHDLTAITGQKPIKTRSKKSISNFNLRLNQEIGCKTAVLPANTGRGIRHIRTINHKKGIDLRFFADFCFPFFPNTSI